MVSTIRLNEENFFMWAMQHYHNPHCLGMVDFEEDLARFTYIKRLLNKYQKSGVLQERLLLNHIISLYNVFGVATVPLLFFKIDRQYWPQLKTFLVFLNYLPDGYVIEGEVPEVNVGLDTGIVTTLRSI
jgi:hypothetical protein